MLFVGLILGLISAIAWARATTANFRTSLVFSVIWGWIAWAGLVAALIGLKSASFQIALALIGCASVSVLGARWPGAAAWQFVVVALLAVLLLPIAEAYLRGAEIQASLVRRVFVGGLLFTIIANYLPTRLGLAAMMLAGALITTSAVMSIELAPRLAELLHEIGLCCACGGPAAAWLVLATGRGEWSPSTRLWLDFRDRFGAIWSLRLMEQFNRSAANAGLSARLHWRGLRGPQVADEYARLAALMKRFGLPAAQKLGPPGPPPIPPRPPAFGDVSGGGF
jgi:hypothetical protein